MMLRDRASVGQRHDSPASSFDWASVIDDARSGSRDAITKIVSALSPYLLAVAEGELGTRVRNKFGASDVLQQSFVKAQGSIGTFRGRSEPELRRWLRSIVLNTISDETRKFTTADKRDLHREECSVSSPGLSKIACDKSPSASAIVSRSEDRVQLLNAISKLPRDQRYVVEQRHGGQRGYSEIAAEMGISVNAARCLWTRAAKQLKQIVTQPQQG